MMGGYSVGLRIWLAITSRNLNSSFTLSARDSPNCSAVRDAGSVPDGVPTQSTRRYT
jgi:hypothetical protein